MHSIDFMFKCNALSCNLFDNGFEDLMKSCTLNEINPNDVQVFGLKIKLDKLSLNTIHHLFSTFRKYSDYLRNSALTTNEFLSSRNNNLKLNWSFLREEIIHSLSLFKYLLNHKSSPCSIEIKRTILIELKHLLLSIGRISSLPELVFYELFASTCDKQGATNQLFHLHLDIWWNVYQMLKSTDNLLKDDLCLIRDKSFNSADLLNQVRNLLLVDLISVSLIKFNLNHLDANYRHLDNAFCCSCIKLIYVLIYLESNDGTEFWNDFNKILDEFSKDEEQDVESVKHFQWINKTNKKLDQMASLWLISSLADLFQQQQQIEHFDDEKKQLKYQDNNLYVCNLVKSLIRQFEENQSEINIIITILKLCLKLNKNASIDIVLVFFDFFMKNLNTPFQLNNVKNIQMLPKSAHVWNQRLESLDRIELNSEENINQLFYYLIYNFVKRSVDDHSASNHFQKFKGRLYSKLQAKKIEEFKEIGLYNLLNTFIVTSYASSRNSESAIDLLNKFLFVVKVVKNKSLYNSRMMLVFRSLFCFNYFLTNSQDLIRLNEIIVELFNEICESIPSWSLNNIQISTVHNAYFELVNVYCNEILDYFKHQTSPNSSFGNLFKCKFNSLLHKLSEREVLSILQFIQNLISEIKFKIENEDGDLSFYTGIYELMNEQFIDFLKSQMKTTFNPQIPDVVYEFIYMTTLLSTNEQNFKCLIDNFLFNKSTNMFNVCELIVKIVDCDTIFSKLLDVYYACNVDKKLMELWFQLAITIQLPSERFNKLTQQLSIQFPIFKSSNINLLAVNDVFSNLADKYQQATSNQDKGKMSTELNQCLAEMVNQGKNMLKDEHTINEESLNQLYTILSFLIQNCYPMIFMKGNNSWILPQLLETFFNPNYIQSLSAARIQNVNNCLRKTLPKVLNGLAKLQGKVNDPYIDRKMKTLFITYIPLFHTKGSTHPILVELIQSRSLELFFTLLHYLKDCLFIRPPTPTNPALNIQLIQFVSDFYSSVRNGEQKNQIFKMFPLFLDKMLTSEELTKRKIRDLLTLMVNSNNGEENLNKNLIEYYEEFINKNKGNMIRVIKVLEFTLSFCLLIREKIISILMYLIKQIEDSSSSGVDDLLRTCFQQFVNKISN